MIKGIIFFILAIICTGCASSKVNASSVKVVKVENPTPSSRQGKKDYGECQMMQNGYLVCPKTAKK